MCSTPYHHACPTCARRSATSGLLLDPHQEPLRLSLSTERAELGPEGKERGGGVERRSREGKRYSGQEEGRKRGETQWRGMSANVDGGVDGVRPSRGRKHVEGRTIHERRKLSERYVSEDGGCGGEERGWESDKVCPLTNFFAHLGSPFFSSSLRLWLT